MKEECEYLKKMYEVHVKFAKFKHSEYYRKIVDAKIRRAKFLFEKYKKFGGNGCGSKKGV